MGHGEWSWKALLPMGICTLLGSGQVEVNWPHMFSCSAVLFTLCLNDVALWHSCLLSDGPGDVFITCWGLEKDFMAWGSSGRAQTLCALLNWSHWACLLDIRKFLMCSMSAG